MEKNNSRVNVDEMGDHNYQVVNGNIYPLGSYLNHQGEIVTWHKGGSADVGFVPLGSEQ